MDETEEDGRYFEQVDERFIVTNEIVDLDNNSEPRDSFYFISTETFKVTRSLSLLSVEYVYHRGLLFYTHNKESIRVLDVASGTHFNDLRLPFRSKDKPFIELANMWNSTHQRGDEPSAVLLYRWAASNSNVIVIGWRYWNKEKSEILSNLSVYTQVVYDLQAMKKPNSDSQLLYTLQFQFNINSFVMDESEIVLSGKDGKKNRFLTVLKFADFNFAERKSQSSNGNPEANEGIKMEIIRDPYLE